MKFSNANLERSIIGGLFVDPKKLPAAEDTIGSTDFETELCSQIFSAMQNLNSRGLAIDQITVMQELKSRDVEVQPDTWLELINAESTSVNLLSYCNQLKELSDKRRAAAALKEATDALNANKDLQSIFADLESSCPVESGEFRNYKDNNLIRQLVSIVNSDERPEVIPTGFKNLDEAINGGLTQGVYLISAIPGLGKTSFVSQILDYIAFNGREALMFNYEMSTPRLLARNLARLAYRQNKGGVDPERIPKAMEIYLKTLYTPSANESVIARADREKKIELLSEAQDNYEAAAQNLYYVECDGAYTASRIERRIARHIAETGHRPVVALDYLQIMPAMNPKQINAVEVISENLSELTRISRRFDIPVIVISATSRENYGKRANLAAFKGSGTAEYTASFGAVMYYSALDQDRDIDLLTPEEKEHVTMKLVKGRDLENTGALEFELKGAWACFEESIRRSDYKDVPIV